MSRLLLRRSRRWHPMLERIEPRIVPSGLAAGFGIRVHPSLPIVANHTAPKSHPATPGSVPLHPPIPFSSKPRTFKSLAYRSDSGSLNVLDVYLPAGRPPAGGWPVVMAIHGGGWRRFSKDDYGPKAAVLTHFGYAVVAPDYTLSSSGAASWPRNLEDLRGAVRWVRQSAPRYHVNPDQVAAIGESAGGHLALLLGMSPDPVKKPKASAAVQAVASFAGPTDLKTLGLGSPFAGWAARQMMGSSPGQQPAAYASASPLVLVGSNDPPILLVHGLLDNVVPPSQSVELAAALKADKVPSQLVLIPGAGHLLPFNLGSEPLDRLVRFLRTALARTPVA